VNTTKTKVVIFSKKKVRQNQSFKIKGQNIEIIDSYKIRKRFMYICIDSSQRFVMLHNGSTLFSSKKDSKSFKDKEKKKGIYFPLA
jgi:hypothetical protein